MAQMSFGSFRVPKRIIVLESDDWGSIRTPVTFKPGSFGDLPVNLDKSPYLQYDRLENVEDLEHLIRLFQEIGQNTGQTPKMTMNFVMANPDFSKIENADFQQYFYEPFTETYQRDHGDQKVLELVKEGINRGMFLPQFHGREHVQAILWLNMLRQKDPVYTKAFQQGLWGIGPECYPQMKTNIQASFDLCDERDLEFASTSIDEGLELFESVFGFRSMSFIPNNYIWPDSLNPVLKEAGLEFMQGMKYQKLPKCREGKKRLMLARKSGKMDQWGPVQIVRNTSMELSLSQNRDRVLQQCIRDIRTSFLLKQPAVISIHRINFMGGIDIKNREKNLDLMRKFFLRVNELWPDAEFMNTVELGQYLKSINKK